MLSSGGDGTDTLDADDLADQGTDACDDFFDSLEDIEDDFDLDDVESFEDDLDDDEQEEVAAAIDSARSDLNDALSGIQPEDDADDWADLVADLDQGIEELFDALLADDDIDDAAEDLDDVSDALLEDFEVECGGSGMTEPEPEPEPTTTTTIEIDPPTTTAPPSGNFTAPVPPGDFADPEEAALAEACYQGDMASCDDLWLTSPVGSEEEAYAESCGGRTTEDLSNDCEEQILDPILPGGSGSGLGFEQNQPVPPPNIADPALAALADSCFEGDMNACEDLFLDAPDGPAEDYGFDCGGRVPASESVGSCLDIEDPTLP